MGESQEITTRTVELVASDGVELVGDISVPAGCRGGAIVCHPHPQFGGNRFNHVVTALFDALPTVGLAALRFDFRREFREGVSEVEDARAAIDTLAGEVPGVPIVATGYSFGAVVALALRDDRAVGKVLVAPPLGIRGRAPTPDVATLVLTPDRDQFCPPEIAKPVVAGWPHGELQVVEAADHFLNDRAAAVALNALVWIDQLLG